MCDYSLHGIKNRLAREGETLITYRFYTGSKGLTSPEYLNPVQPARGLWAKLKSLFECELSVCAVCIPDGARLILDGVSPEFQRRHHLSTIETVTFRQLSAKAGTYRDAFEFANGRKVLLQELDEGLHVQVCELSPAESILEGRLIAAN